MAPAAFATRLAAYKSAMVKTAKVVLPVRMVVSRRASDERTASGLSGSAEAELATHWVGGGPASAHVAKKRGCFS